MIRILISGTTGFIGSELIKVLDSSKYDVWGTLRNVAGRYVLGENVNKYFCDLTDHFTVNNMVRELKPEIVVHLAAISSVSYSYTHPIEVMNTNIMSLVNLAEACMRYDPNLVKFIQASSSESYGWQERFPIEENFIQRPNSPYSASKVAIERYLEFLWKAYEFPVIIARPFNTYGRKNDRNFFVERCVTQMLKNPAGTIYLGDPSPIRDFLYVSDHIDAYLNLIETDRDVFGEAFNFCTGMGSSIQDMASKIAELSGFQEFIEWRSIPQRPYDIPKLIGSNAKSKRVLGWEPKVSLEEGLLRTIEHWRKKLAFS